MPRNTDATTFQLIDLLDQAAEPLETKEIERILEEVSRIKVLYRLHNLRGDGIIKGKPVGSGKGTWIWWRKDVF